MIPIVPLDFLAFDLEDLDLDLDLLVGVTLVVFLVADFLDDLDLTDLDLDRLDLDFLPVFLVDFLTLFFFETLDLAIIYMKIFYKI